VKVKGGYKSGEVLWMACVQLLVFANGAELSRDYLGISSGHSALSPVMAEASFSPSLGQVPFRGVHGNGEDWDPMGPMGFPWE